MAMESKAFRFVAISLIAVVGPLLGCMYSTTTELESRQWTVTYVEEVTITTIPPGAAVYLREKRIGNAPITTRVRMPGRTVEDQGRFEEKGFWWFGVESYGWDQVGNSERVSSTRWNNAPHFSSSTTGLGSYTVIAYAEGFEPTKKTVHVYGYDSVVRRANDTIRLTDGDRLRTTIVGKRDVLVTLRPLSGPDRRVSDAPRPQVPSARADARRAAQAEYDAALAAYNQAIEERDDMEVLDSLTQAGATRAMQTPGGSAGISLLGAMATTAELQGAERNVTIARERLDRARARLDSTD